MDAVILKKNLITIGFEAGSKTPIPYPKKIKISLKQIKKEEKNKNLYKNFCLLRPPYFLSRLCINV